MNDGASVREFWKAVAAVFGDAVELDGADREALLDARCDGQADLRAEVDSLLATHARAARFMRDPTGRDAAHPRDASHSDLSTDDSAAPLLAEGDLVGPFRLVERMASGGMGTVYRAERVEGGFTQQVAVKLIAAPMTHDTAARRFRAERQILASLQHPHIVTLIDGGVTPRGEAYLVMEYIDGVPISTYCRDRALGLVERLRLFRQVCDAVQYAHAHAVVHRDLKPANVLVTMNGVPKVLDFGVAKLIEEPLETATEETLRGMAPLTPNYASPEQLRGLPVTTAADIYALGVLLFELLTGTRPYETAGKPLDDVMRLVVDTQAGRPSAAQSPEEVRPPYEWRRALRGDLDAIALCALRKEAAERYASADAFSKDIGRYINGEPVEAREPSFMYVARKLAARHRAAFASAGLAAVVVLAATAMALWQARVANLERVRAGRRFNEVRQLAHALIFDIHDSVEPLPGSTPVRKTIVSQGLQYLERLAPESGGDPELQVELARAYIKIGAVQGRPNTPNLGDRTGAISSFRKARALLAPSATTPEASAPVFASYLDATRFLSETLFLGGQRDEALAVAREGAAGAAKFAEQHPEIAERRGFVALAEFELAVAVGVHDSLPHWQKAGAAYEALLAEQPDNPAYQRNVALVEKYLGGYYESTNDYPAALIHHQRALDLDQKRYDRAPDTRTTQLDLAIDLGNVAYAHLMRHEVSDAIAGYERSLFMRQRLLAADPKDALLHSKVAYVQGQLGSVLAEYGDGTAALRHLHAAVDEYDAAGLSLDGEKSRAADTLMRIGAIEQAAAHRAAACTAVRRAFDLLRGVSAQERNLHADAETVTHATQILGTCGVAAGTTSLAR
jgi:serine/threonine protein kinase